MHKKATLGPNYKKYLKFIPRYIFYKSVLQFKAYGRKTGVDG